MADPQGLSRLLQALAVGPETSLITPESWWRHFEAAGAIDSPAQHFLTQLRQEWMPIFMPDGRSYYAYMLVRRHLSAHPQFAPLWAHSMRVAGYCLGLAREAGVELETAFVIGITHDIGKLEEAVSGERHEQIGARWVEARLRRQLSPLTLRLIQAIIGKRAGWRNPYRQLLSDADKLDKIGATGIARRLSAGTGARHIVTTLRRMQTEVNAFRPMHFSASVQLAEQKLAFTREFLSAAGQALG